MRTSISNFEFNRVRLLLASFILISISIVGICRIFSSSPMILIMPILLSITIWMMLTWKLEYALWILIIFSINVFGIFHGMSIPHITLPKLGTFHLKDIILVVLTLHALHRSKVERNSIVQKAPLIRPLYALLAVVLLNTAIDLCQGIDPHYLLRGYRRVAYYLVFFVILREIKTKKQLSRFIAGLMVIAFITASVSYLQFAFGWSLPGSKVEYMSEFVLYRIYQTGGYLVSLCLLIIFSIASSGRLKSRKNQIIAWFIFVWFIGSQLLSFARSLWGAIAIGLIFIISRQVVRILRSSLIMVPILVASFLLANVGIKSLSDNNLNEIVEARAKTAIEDFMEKEGTFYNRLLLLDIKWKTVKSENPIFGIGFDSAVPVSGSIPMNYIINLSPHALVADNSLANIILLFGVSGVFIFLWMFFSFFRHAYMLWKKLPNSVSKSVVLGIISFNITTIAVSFFGDCFTSPHSVSILAMSWAIVILIAHFERKGRGHSKVG